VKLRAVEVRNWACIDSLSLADLGDGIIVLHGPNRTGKSSLVQALRSGLFDHYHDSRDSTVLSAIPWKTKAAPHVAIEFDHAGKRYRISKTFAKTKEGHSTLEQHDSGEWTVLERGKDATKRVRELLDVESSAAGIFQMLWLGQRDFALPKPKEMDTALEKALESVLGILITGPDIDFKERLDKACERWFTVTSMKDRKDSPVTRLAADVEAASTRKDQVDRQWADAESTLQQYDEALAQRPLLKHLLGKAEVDLERIQKECEHVRQRASQFELALQSRQQCRQLYQKAEERLREFDDVARQLEAAIKLWNDLTLELRNAEQKRAQAEQAAAASRKSADAAQQDLARHQQSRSALEDRQRLVTNQFEQRSLEEKIRQVLDLDKRRLELEQELTGAVVYSEKQIQELRQNREMAATLRVQLEAREIHISIRANGALDFQVASDSEASQRFHFDALQERRWLVRQRAELQLGDLAAIRIGRGEEDRDLDDIARELSQLERFFRETLSAAGLDSNDPAALDELVSRRLQREEGAKQLRIVRETIAKAAPHGIPALLAQFQQKQAERENLLARQPALGAWTPDQAELDRLCLEFSHHEAKLASLAQEAKQAWERSIDLLRRATEAEQSIRASIAAKAALVQSLTDSLGKQERPALVHECDQAKDRLADAEQKVQQSTLSEAEQALETQYQKVRGAFADCSERLRSNDILLAELRTKLAGAEGLHQKRIQAEQAVNDRTREYEREKLHAEAHKHLKETFEQVRQEQVRRTVGPINDRVMSWAKQLGLNDYAGLSFGDQLLPAGLVAAHASNGELIEMERESYGTLEQLSLLIRLAVGGLLARNESAVAILDDPLAHADPGKHRQMLEILARAAHGEPSGPHPTGPLQLIILTCHKDRFDQLDGAQQFDLARLIRTNRH
jgi:energy-coupling factor transporter ATP-binding protein EcfA2